MSWWEKLEVVKEAVMAAVVDWIISTVLCRFSSMNVVDVNDQLEHLDMQVTKLYSVVEEAQRVQIRSLRLRQWFSRLYEAAVEGDEVLRWFTQRPAVNPEVASTGNKPWRRWLFPFCRRDDGAHRLCRTVARLENVSSGIGDFLKLLKMEISRSMSMQATPTYVEEEDEDDDNDNRTTVETSNVVEVHGRHWLALANWRRELQAVAHRANNLVESMQTLSEGRRRMAQGVEMAFAHRHDFLTLISFSPTVASPPPDAHPPGVQLPGNLSFMPAAPRQKGVFPSIVIDPIRWLTDVVLSLGGDKPLVRRTRHKYLWTLHVCFNIPVRGENYRNTHVSVSGKSAPHMLTCEKNVVRECVKALAENEYHLHDLSYFRIKALQENEDVAAICERIARMSNDDYDVDALDNSLTTHSFRSILTQALEQLGHYSFHCESWTTSQGEQAMVHFHANMGPIGPPLCIIYGRLCHRSCEAKESALIRALLYIDDVLGYKIGDVHYVEYLITLGQSKCIK